MGWRKLTISTVSDSNNGTFIRRWCLVDLVQNQIAFKVSANALRQTDFISGFSSNKAESIFAKYRNQQNQGSSSSDASEAPSEDPETLPERPVVETSNRPPVAPSTRRSKRHFVKFTLPLYLHLGPQVYKVNKI